MLPIGNVDKIGLVWLPNLPILYYHTLLAQASLHAFTLSQAISFVSCYEISVWQAPTQILRYFRHLKLENSMCTCTCLCVYMYVYVYTRMPYESHRRPRTNAMSCDWCQNISLGLKAKEQILSLFYLTVLT